MLRVAASRVGPLALSFWEGPIIFRPGPTYYGGLVNDTTPVINSVFIECVNEASTRLRTYTWSAIKPISVNIRFCYNITIKMLDLNVNRLADLCKKNVIKILYHNALTLNFFPVHRRFILLEALYFPAIAKMNIENFISFYEY